MKIDRAIEEIKEELVSIEATKKLLEEMRDFDYTPPHNEAPINRVHSDNDIEDWKRFYKCLIKFERDSYNLFSRSLSLFFRHQRSSAGKVIRVEVLLYHKAVEVISSFWENNVLSIEYEDRAIKESHSVYGRASPKRFKNLLRLSFKELTYIQTLEILIKQGVLPKKRFFVCEQGQRVYELYNDKLVEIANYR